RADVPEIGTGLGPRLGRFGDYHLEQLLGSGGLGYVYRAIYRPLRQERALKILSPLLSPDDRFIERFRREAFTAAGLDHPNIVPIYDLGEVEGFHYIAMKLLAGVSLSTLLFAQGRMDLRHALTTLAEAAGALDYAHRQRVLHRDFKPANIV